MKSWAAWFIGGVLSTPSHAFYWDGTWHDTMTFSAGAVIDMQVRGNEIWILNQIGASYRFNGSTWDTYRTGKDALFNLITIAGPGDVWISGDNGMLHYTDP